jgi:hypothetical protein
VLGIEAVPSQSTLSRFFARCGRSAGESTGRPARAGPCSELPGRDVMATRSIWDSFALVHEDGHQEGVRVGYTRKGLKPCHRPIVAALGGGAASSPTFGCARATPPVSVPRYVFLGDTLARLPAGQCASALVRADSGFCTARHAGTELEARKTCPTS